MEARNCAVCVAVHTATGGRSPDRRHCSTRYGVHTTARGRRARGSSALLAAFSLIIPRRIAAFSAARKVAWIRVSVAADTGVPRAWCWRMIAVNIACTCPADSSASSTSPRYGARYRRIWAA
jgi:hypothetical protein